MNLNDRIRGGYFNWLATQVGWQPEQSEYISFYKLLAKLHSTEFTYSHPRDENRASDGIGLRYKFGVYHRIKDAPYIIEGPCSVLEMMVALATKCEDTFMDDPRFGDRTSQWFWGMVSSLGLASMTDAAYDETEATYILYRFMNREYEADGRGGLFTVRRCVNDLREVEIWTQMCWYLDTIQ